MHACTKVCNIGRVKINVHDLLISCLLVTVAVSLLATVVYYCNIHVLNNSRDTIYYNNNSRSHNKIIIAI